MNFARMYDTQGMLFLLMLLGLLLRRNWLITDEGERFLTDLVLYVTLPASILKSFQMELSADLMRSCMKILFVSICMIIISFLLGKLAFSHLPSSQRKVMEYAAIVSNAGVLGNPVAEGIFGSIGLMCASVYAVPLRLYMWSLGVMCFTEALDIKTLLKKTCTHPCILAVVLGLFMLVFQFSLPDVLNLTINHVADANTCLSMVLVGAILSSVPFKSVLDKMTIYYSAIRLIILPLVALLICRAIDCSSMLAGTAVILTGMPAGSTTAVLAEKYGGDAALATKCVVLSTILSMLSIPVWCVFTQ